MATNNPKVSAYISPHIFDRFKEFYEERQLSMSQAVAVIFAEYFQLEEQVNHDSKLPSGLLTDRLVAIEQKLTSLETYQSDSVSELLSEFRNLTTRVSNLEQNLDSSNKIESQSKTHSNQLNLLETDHQSNYIKAIESSEPLDSSLSKLPANPINTSLLQPLVGKALALRLNVTEGALSKGRVKMDSDVFYDWLKKKDPDGVQWIPVEKTEKFRKGYVPDENTSSELLDKLLAWRIQNNIV